MSEPAPSTSTSPKPPFTWVFAAGLVLAVLAAGLAWWAASPKAPAAGEGASKVSAGETAPAFTRKTLDGKAVSLTDYRGRVVLVDFWATWCGPCHLQAKVLEPLYAEYRGRGVEFVSVSVGEEAGTVRDFLAQNPSPYPVLIDPEDTLSADLGIVALPTLLIVDRSGKIAYFNFGLSDADTLRRALTQAGAA
jgi:peroxiredoxin